MQNLIGQAMDAMEIALDEAGYAISSRECEIAAKACFAFFSERRPAPDPEAVARAICKAADVDPDEHIGGDDAYSDNTCVHDGRTDSGPYFFAWRLWEKCARAAIAAMERKCNCTMPHGCPRCNPSRWISDWAAANPGR